MAGFWPGWNRGVLENMRNPEIFVTIHCHKYFISMSQLIGNVELFPKEYLPSLKRVFLTRKSPIVDNIMGGGADTTKAQHITPNY